MFERKTWLSSASIHFLFQQSIIFINLSSISRNNFDQYNALTRILCTNPISISVKEASFLSTEHLLRNNSLHESSSVIRLGCIIFKIGLYHVHVLWHLEVNLPEVKAPVTEAPRVPDNSEERVNEESWYRIYSARPMKAEARVLTIAVLYSWDK